MLRYGLSFVGITPLNLVIVHYHLQRGGVTSVIANQIHALNHSDSAVESILVLYGNSDGEAGGSEACSGWDPGLEQLEHVSVSLVAMESLAYQTEIPGIEDDLAEKLDAEIQSTGFRRADTVVQIHNHNLGKNLALTASIPKLARQGYNLLLQVHDFAEDLRPGNFGSLRNGARQLGFLRYEDFVFPRGERIHYACLNQRDRGVLANIGIATRQIHFLPNPVQGASIADTNFEQARQRIRKQLELPNSTRLAIYPVRAIRRKNIGEALLFAAANSDVHLLITLPAASAAELPVYRRFEALIEEHNLPVTLAAGTRFEFEDLIAAADFVMSTSIAEGFGMVFLECWLWGKQLVGRDLPEITSDFVQDGLQLDGLYDRLLIPTDWFDSAAEQLAFEQRLNQTRQEYGLPAIEESELGLESDFARLQLATQCQLIVDLFLDRIRVSGKLVRLLLELNPAFRCPDRPDEALISENGKVVREKFSLQTFFHRYQETLRNVLHPPTIPFQRSESEVKVQALSATQSVVHQFLAPDRFFPVRVETGES